MTDLAQKIADAVEVALGDDGHCIVYKRLAVVEAIRTALPVAQEGAATQHRRRMMSEKPYNPWREFIENCEKGDNFFRSSEYMDLLDYIDGLLSRPDLLASAPSAPASQTEAQSAAPVAQEGADEFSTEGVKRVADKMRREGQPILASALMDLAEQRDTLRAQLAERDEDYQRVCARMADTMQQRDGVMAKLAERDEQYADALNEIMAITNAIPGPVYMDPPDGGCTTIAEQVRRMAADVKATDAKLAASEARVGVLEKSLRHYGTHSDHCEKSRFVNPSVCTCGYEAALSQPGKGEM